VFVQHPSDKVTVWQICSVFGKWKRVWTMPEIVVLRRCGWWWQS